MVLHIVSFNNRAQLTLLPKKQLYLYREEVALIREYEEERIGREILEAFASKNDTGVT